MSNRITGKVLAVQLGREETQLVLLGNANEILYAVTLHTPDGAVEDGMIRNQEAVRQMLKSALKEGPLKKARQVVFTLCTSQVIAETVTTPDLPTAKLEKLLRANADMYFPVDTQEYQLVWQVVGPKQGEGGAKELVVQLWAVPISMVSPYYTLANSCGLSVAAIDYCGHSMATAAGASFSRPGSAGKKKDRTPVEADAGSGQIPDTDLHLLLDKDLLGMTFVQNGQVVMQRIVRCGSNPAYQFGELAMMLEYFRSMDTGRGSRIRGIVSGAYAWDNQLTDELADTLGIALTRLSVSYDLRWCLCVGAARTFLDFGIPSLNIPGKARKEIGTQLWQYILVLLSGLALLAVILYTLSSQLVWDAEISGLQNQVDTLTIQSAKSAGFKDNYVNYQNKYNAYSNDWETVFTSLQTYNNNLVLVLDELETILPENASVAQMEIGASGLNVVFACENKEEAAYLIMALREMQYADLMEISDLQGGGAGPATSYGSGEEAPLEGSSGLTAEERSLLAEALSADLDPYVVGYNLGLGVGTDNYLTELEEVYGITPKNTYHTIRELKEGESENLTYEIRANAFHAMCTTNPFAMNSADELLMQDYKDGGSLYPYIEEKLMDEGVSLLSVYRHKSPEDLEADITLLTGLITTYDSTFAALDYTEALICSDVDAEALYIYYLEAELEKAKEPGYGTETDTDTEEEEAHLPYLDMDALVDDLLDGSFNSQYDGLNTALYSLVSQETLALLEELTTETPSESTDPSEDPGESTIPSVPTIPSIPTDPSEDPSESTDPSESESTDPSESESTLPTIPSESTDPSESESTDPSESESTDPSESTNPSGDYSEYYAKIDKILPYYLNGSLNAEILGMLGISEEYIEIIDDYFIYGSTGIDQADEVLNAYVSEGKADDSLKELLYQYQNDPESVVNEAVRQMITNYYAGGTGNDVLDAQIAKCLEGLEDYIAGKVTRWLKLYLTYGKTYDDNGNVMIEQYLTTGVTDDDTSTELLDAYVTEGNVDSELKNLLYYYLYNKGAINNKPIVTMFDNYYAGTTGSSALDAKIKVLGKTIASDAINNAIQNSGNAGGGGGGEGSAEQDTRVYFLVVLNYNEDLRQAELNRKGLDYTDKVEPLEVE